jgi:hypothetical protein
MHRAVTAPALGAKDDGVEDGATVDGAKEGAKIDGAEEFASEGRATGARVGAIEGPDAWEHTTGTRSAQLTDSALVCSMKGIDFQLLRALAWKHTKGLKSV